MTILGADDEGRLRALLDSLGYDLEPSILIGGWATNARVGGEISHDIDLIITDQNLRQRLAERLTEYSENHLRSGGRKARGNADGVHVDAYFPYESKLGTRLLLDVGALTRYVDPDLKVEGWLMLTLDAHIATADLSMTFPGTCARHSNSSPNSPDSTRRTVAATPPSPDRRS